MIDGSATLLTGGTLVGEARNEPNLSGKALDGGTTQRFGKGAWGRTRVRPHDAERVYRLSAGQRTPWLFSPSAPSGTGPMPL
jgi:hypothetical protein